MVYVRAVRLCVAFFIYFDSLRCSHIRYQRQQRWLYHTRFYDAHAQTFLRWTSSSGDWQWQRRNEPTNEATQMMREKKNIIFLIETPFIENHSQFIEQQTTCRKFLLTTCSNMHAWRISFHIFSLRWSLNFSPHFPLHSIFTLWPAIISNFFSCASFSKHHFEYCEFARFLCIGVREASL